MEETPLEYGETTEAEIYADLARDLGQRLDELRQQYPVPQIPAERRRTTFPISSWPHSLTRPLLSMKSPLSLVGLAGKIIRWISHGCSNHKD